MTTTDDHSIIRDDHSITDVVHAINEDSKGEVKYEVEEITGAIEPQDECDPNGDLRDSIELKAEDSVIYLSEQNLNDLLSAGDVVMKSENEQTFTKSDILDLGADTTEIRGHSGVRGHAGVRGHSGVRAKS